MVKALALLVAAGCAGAPSVQGEPVDGDPVAWAEGGALVAFGSDAELAAWVQRFGRSRPCQGSVSGGVVFEPRWLRVRGVSAEPDIDAGGEVAWTDTALVVIRGRRLISLRRDPHTAIASVVTLPARSRSKVFALGDAVLLVTEDDDGVWVARYGLDRGARLREQRHVRLPPSGISSCVARPQDGTWVTEGRFVLYTGRALDPARGPLSSALAIDGGASLHRPLVRVEHPMLHAAVTCDLALSSCRTIGVIAGAATATHVSPEALYVWTEAPIVYRLPLSGPGPPAAARLPFHPAEGAIHFHEARDGLRIAVVETSRRHDGVPRAALASFTAGASTAASPVPLVAEPLDVSFFDEVGWVGARGRRLTVAALDGRSRPRTIEVAHRVDVLVRPVESRVMAVRMRGPLALTILSRDGRALPRWVAADRARALGGPYVEESGGTLRVAVPARFMLPLAHPQEVAGAIFLELRGGELIRLGHLVADDRVVDERCPIECHEDGLRSHALLIGDRAFSIVGLHLAEGRVSDGVLGDVRRLDLDADRP